MRKTKVIVLVVVVSIIIGICGCVKKEPSAVIPESKIEIDYDNGNEKGIYFYRDELKIYGKLFLPEGEGPFPVVILSSPHGCSAFIFVRCDSIAERERYSRCLL